MKEQPSEKNASDKYHDGTFIVNPESVNCIFHDLYFNGPREN
jgi:hypothetical protein